MRSFTHINTETIDEVFEIHSSYNENTQIIAGGTDLLLTPKAD